MRKILLAAFLLALGALPAKAQQSFSPNGKYASLTASGSSSATTTLPQGAVVGVFNTGTVPVSCNMDPVNAVATPNQIIVYSSIALTVGANTQIACIDQSGSTSNVVVLAGGAGVLSGGGGGGAGTSTGGLSVIDSANFTAGVSPMTPSGCEYSSSALNLVSGQQGSVACSIARHQLMLEDNSAAILTAAQAGTGATGAAVPASAIYAAGINPSGNLTGIGIGGTAVAGSQAVNFSSQYPVNNVTTAPIPITGNATGSTGSVVGTLAAAAGKTTFICGFTYTMIGGSAAPGPVTVAGLTGSSMVFQTFSIGTSAILGVNLQQNFNPCVPASAANTAITITTTADGTATATDVNSWGYQL